MRTSYGRIEVPRKENNECTWLFLPRENHCQRHFHFPLCLLPAITIFTTNFHLCWEIPTLVCRLVPLTHPEGVSRLEHNEGLGGHARIRPCLFLNSHLVTSLGKVHLILKIVRCLHAHTHTQKRSLCFLIVVLTNEYKGWLWGPWKHEGSVSVLACALVWIKNNASNWL